MVTNNQEILRELMAEYPAINTMKKLAFEMDVSYNTVHAYLKPVTSKSHRAIPEQRLNELKSKLRNDNAATTGNANT